MTKVLSLRVPDDLAAWADEYAAAQGVTRQALLEMGLRSFKEDCEGGVPEFRAMAASQADLRRTALEALQGVGDCPERPGELGHIWKSAKDDSRRPCSFCGLPGRGEPTEDDPRPGFLHTASAERAALFSQLKTPESAWGKKKEKS